MNANKHKDVKLLNKNKKINDPPEEASPTGIKRKENKEHK